MKNLLNKPCSFLGPSEDKEAESSPEESEDNADEEDPSFEDSDGEKFLNRFFFLQFSMPLSFGTSLRDRHRLSTSHYHVTSFIDQYCPFTSI